jgi:hypothetical protein
MTNNSNQYGRSFEYAVAQTFIDKMYMINGESKTRHNNNKQHFDKLPYDRKVLYKKAAKVLFVEFSINYKKRIGNDYTIFNFPDNSGDVIDLKIGSLFISLKVNHDALRHNRPGGLGKRCGVSEAESDKFKAIIYLCNKKLIKTKPNAIEFKEFSKSAISKYYKNVQIETINFLEDWKLRDPNIVKNYFNYLVSNDLDYIKVQLNTEDSEVSIIEFQTVREPTDFKLVYNKINSHIDIEFNNGWVISKRLHTASSRVDSKANLSIKWDVRLLDRPVNIKTTLKF